MSALRFEYAAPTSLPEAIRLLSEAAGRAHVLAGGTDLLLKLRNATPTPGGGAEPLLVGLKRIPELSRMTWDPQAGLTIGATTRLADVAADEAVRRHYPAIAHAASQTGTPQIRNMGTVVGNICNAAPSADNVPALLVMGAHLLAEGPGGRRDLPLADFFRGPGKTALLRGRDRHGSSGASSRPRVPVRLTSPSPLEAGWTSARWEWPSWWYLTRRVSAGPPASVWARSLPRRCAYARPKTLWLGG